MKTIFILMDSLNRHYLPVYGNNWVIAPNIQRLADRGVVFDNHYCASMPCMPARRDLLNGRYNFLQAPWGPMEPFDEKLPVELRRQCDTYSHMTTDHYHYWEWFGLGYHTPYDTWEFLRGQEGDHWHPQVQPPDMPAYRGKNRRQDWINRQFMDLQRDEDYPTPQCFAQAMEFLDRNHDADNWMLHLEVFDPHEPFLTPNHYRELYDDVWTGDYLIDWPPYAPLDPEADTPEAIAHIQKQYAATLTRADAWLGRLIDRMDKYGMWEDTTVILTTDHGHLLGDHGYWAKNYMFDYQELVHIPLIVAGAGVPAGERRTGLTSTIDLMPTILELHGGQPSEHVQGRSIRPLLTRDGEHHDAVLYGYFAKDVSFTDGRYTYTRQPQEGSTVDHHTAMAVHATIERHAELWANAECGKFLPQANMPVYRIPLPSRRHHNAPDAADLVYDIQADPHQQTPLTDEPLRARLETTLTELLHRYNAPPCQYNRTGLHHP
ncbi:MAG: sulfatase-like hydrolase/transferase [Planctomycetota bacterium]